MTEAEIVRGLSLSSERESAIRQLTERFGMKLFQRIKSIVSVEADAQDVYQNTLIKVLRGIKTFKADSSLYSWLYRIASNEALDFLRKRNRTASTPFGKTSEENVNHNLLDGQTAETQGVEASEIEDLLQAAIETLPTQQRIVFEARYFNETPYAELAKKFSKSEGALKANYHHAVQKVTAFVQTHAPISIS
ncbi:MAG: RNA polymerase sigma factor [Saprospiraceae bacterium]